MKITEENGIRWLKDQNACCIEAVEEDGIEDAWASASVSQMIWVLKRLEVPADLVNQIQHEVFAASKPENLASVRNCGVCSQATGLEGVDKLMSHVEIKKYAEEIIRTLVPDPGIYL